LLDPVASQTAERTEAEAARLTEWLAGVLATPRFPTPLEREFTG
jgi:hypothetical protein